MADLYKSFFNFPFYFFSCYVNITTDITDIQIPYNSWTKSSSCQGFTNFPYRTMPGEQ